jgi:uncharacterized protein (TIGR00369 family)
VSRPARRSGSAGGAPSAGASDAGAQARGAATAVLPAENPDRVIVAEAIRWSLTDVPVHANPVAESMRMILVSAERGRVRLRFDIDQRFTQGDGVIQGGIVTAMLDFGMAFAGLSVVDEGESVATVGINVNFLRVSAPGRFEVEARLEKVGRRMVFARADLMREDGEPVASASAPLTILTRRAEPTGGLSPGRT